MSRSENKLTIMIRLKPVFGFFGAICCVVAVAAETRCIQISPEDITSCIRNETDCDLIRIWEELGIKSELISRNSTINEVEKFIITPTEDSGPVVLVRIQVNSWDFQYLVFELNGKADWRFKGNIEFTVQKYSPPKHRLVHIDLKNYYLAFMSLSSTGTGVSLYEQTWHTIRTNSVGEVLRFPVKGHVNGWGLPFNRSFNSRIVKTENRDGVPTVEIEYEENYTNGYYDDNSVDLLFTSVRKAQYMWDKNTNRFRLNSSQSDLMVEDVEGIFNDGPEGFLRHHYKDIQQLAVSENKDKRNWLKKFIEKLNPTQERQRIEKLLAGNQ